MGVFTNHHHTKSGGSSRWTRYYRVLSGNCFGMVMWSALTGHPPFHHPGTVARVQNIQSDSVLNMGGPKSPLRASRALLCQSCRTIRERQHRHVRRVQDDCKPGILVNRITTEIFNKLSPCGIALRDSSTSVQNLHPQCWPPFQVNQLQTHSPKDRHIKLAVWDLNRRRCLSQSSKESLNIQAMNKSYDNLPFHSARFVRVV